MVITALLLGLAGSLHCVGMCSPLAMAASNLTPAVIRNRLIYNLGRILTYGLLGLLAGSAGALLKFPVYQNVLSVGLGITLLILSFIGIATVRIPVLTRSFAAISTKIKMAFSAFFQRKSTMSVFFLGTLNGLLPCGLTFVSLAYAATLGNAMTSMAHMILFGIGTLPAMLGLTFIFQHAVTRFRLNFGKVTTAMLFLSGCLLIGRVLIYDHPHSSPEEQEVVDIILCR